jgi:propanol-preferring alcohol dehydrogenase
MYAQVLHEFGGSFVAELRDVPEPRAGEVLIEVEAVGAGLTLEHVRQGRLGGSTPRILGHEYSGTVAALGEGVDGLEEGEPVTGTFYLICGRCQWCASGRETLCERMGGYIGAAVDGAFAEYAVVPARNLVPIPEGVPLRTAGVAADAIATPYHLVVERIRLNAGQRVVVVGAGGGLGVHALQMVRAFGGLAVAVERDPGKAVEIEKRGLADAIVLAEGAWAAQARLAAGGRIAAVIDTVAAQDTLEQGLEALDRAGMLVVLGYRHGAALTVDPGRLLLEELVVTGTRYATRAEIARTLELVRLERVEPIIGGTYPLAALNDAFRAF